MARHSEAVREHDSNLAEDTRHETEIAVSTRTVRKVTPNAEAIVDNLVGLTGLHRTLILSACIYAFDRLSPEEQVQYISHAMVEARTSANGTR